MPEKRGSSSSEQILGREGEHWEFGRGLSGAQLMLGVEPPAGVGCKGALVSLLKWFMIISGAREKGKKKIITETHGI